MRDMLSRTQVEGGTCASPEPLGQVRITTRKPTPRLGLSRSSPVIRAVRPSYTGATAASGTATPWHLVTTPLRPWTASTEGSGELAVPQTPASDRTSRHIPQEQQRLLWVRAGGRCELCNKYLLEDPSTMETLNLGELAHNVGHKHSDRSPRGGDPLPVAQRNDAANILLLCGNDHHSIDDKINRGVYTVEYLRQEKKRHEERIRYLTGLGDDAETVVLRVIGDVRGAPVELSEQTAARAVLVAGRRYPRFDWGYAGADFEVDLRTLPTEKSTVYWQAGRDRIVEQLGTRLRDAVARGHVRHLSVFCLARIPLLACVGEYLDDKIPVELFQKQRGGDEGWGWDHADGPVTFAFDRVREGTSEGVALIIGLSAALSVSDLPPELADATVWSITPRERAPSREVLRARSSLDNFARAYHDCVGAIEAVRPKPTAVDVFPAVPAAAAVALGRGLMRDAQPAMRIHDRAAPNAAFEFALEING